MNPLLEPYSESLTLFFSQFSGLYVVSLVVIFVGFITFNAVPIDPSSSSCERGSHDNAAQPSNQEVAVIGEKQCNRIPLDCTRL